MVPATLLTHADVLAALHGCKYDCASAEASLGALRRQREAKYNAAYTRSIADDKQVATSRREQSTPDGVKSGPKRATVNGGESPGGRLQETCGNRWEDWSDADRAAFLKHLGDKVETQPSTV